MRMARAVTTDNHEIASRIAAWQPDGDTLTGAGAELLERTKTAVAAAGPRNPKEAVLVTRYAWEYQSHRAAHNLATEPAIAFTAAEVAAYKKVLGGPDGTKNAVCSYLKRLHPTVGIAGTTRGQPDTTADSTAAAPAQGRGTALVGDLRRELDRVTAAGGVAPAATVAPAVGAAIATYTATLIDPAVWADVAAFVRAAVAVASPTSVARVNNLGRDVAYLTSWVRSENRPVRADVVLAGATIEAFLDVLVAGGLGDRSIATFAANLHAIRVAHHIPLDVVRRQVPAPDPKGPYTRDEVDGFYELAARIPTAQRRRYVTGGLDLMFGTGGGARDTTHTHPADVGIRHDHIGVAFDGRWVPALPDYADSLAAHAHAAAAAGDTYLIGGRGGDRSNRLRALLAARSSGHWGVPVDPARARATWLVEAAATGMFPTVTELLDAAGLETFERLGELLPHIKARRADLTLTAPTANERLDRAS